MMGRRAFLGRTAAAAASGLLARAAGDETARVGEALPPWQPGWLDIHHLATGRGDATVVVAPNGSIALIDAGAVAKADPALVPARPNGSRSAGEWVARFIRHRLRETGGKGLHATMVTHLHPDHVGGVTPNMIKSPNGYRPTGISEVARYVPLGTLLDPDWPDYGYPRFEDVAAAENYVAFTDAFAAAGGRMARLRPGGTGQLLPDHETFSVRIAASRGRVWTGHGVETRTVLPDPRAVAAPDAPNENASASALLLAYGPFRYFAGSDMTDWADAGVRPGMNALLPAAEACGPVHVATLSHHGMFDASSSATIRTLAARDWVCSAWHAAHPSIDVLERVMNPRLYPGPRDVYATAIHPAVDLTMGRLAARLTSRDCHILCRVSDHGRAYRMIVTDNRDEDDRVSFAGEVRATLLAA